MGRSVREPRVDVDLRAKVSSHGPHTPERIVIHDTESCVLGELARSYDPDALRSFAGIANYWQSNGYGTQIIVGPKAGIVGGLASGLTARAVDDDQIAWGVANRNTGSLQIEFEGNAGWTRAHWMLRQTQLHKGARWMAWWSKRWGIPLVYSTERGVSRHADQSRKYGGDHFDPGGGFPFSYLLWLANWYKRNGWP